MCCDLQDWPEDDEMNSVEFRYLCGNTDHSGALEEAGVLEADAIIIGPADDLSDNEVCSLNHGCQQGWVLSALISGHCGVWSRLRMICLSTWQSRLYVMDSTT